MRVTGAILVGVHVRRTLSLACLVVGVVMAACGQSSRDTTASSGDATTTSSTSTTEPDAGWQDDGSDQEKAPRLDANDLSGPLAFRPVAAAVHPGDCPTDDSDPNLYAEKDHAGSVVACYQIAEEGLGEEIVSTAEAVQGPTGSWDVMVTLSDEGGDAFNELASACFDHGPSCPTGQIAILIGRTVISAPAIQIPSFDGQLMISGDFTQADAHALADHLQP